MGKAKQPKQNALVLTAAMQKGQMTRWTITLFLTAVLASPVLQGQSDQKTCLSMFRVYGANFTVKDTFNFKFYFIDTATGKRYNGKFEFGFPEQDTWASPMPVGPQKVNFIIKNSLSNDSMIIPMLNECFRLNKIDYHSGNYYLEVDTCGGRTFDYMGYNYKCWFLFKNKDDLDSFRKLKKEAKAKIQLQFSVDSLQKQTAKQPQTVAQTKDSAKCIDIIKNEIRRQTICYYPNGKKQTQMFFSKTGSSTKILEWYINGKKLYKITYIKAKYRKTISWDENGKRTKEKTKIYHEHFRTHKKTND